MDLMIRSLKTIVFEFNGIQKLQKHENILLNRCIFYVDYFDITLCTIIFNTQKLSYQ